MPVYFRTHYERRDSELIPVPGNQSPGDRSHKRGGRLPLLPVCSRGCLPKHRTSSPFGQYQIVLLGNVRERIAQGR